VSIYREVYGEKDLRKRYVSSLELERKVIDGENSGDDSVDPTCVGW